MKVDFDGLRKALIRQYNDIVEILNEDYDKETETIIVDDSKYNLKKSLEGLERTLITLGCIESDGNTEPFSCLDNKDLETVDVEFLII